MFPQDAGGMFVLATTDGKAIAVLDDVEAAFAAASTDAHTRHDHTEPPGITWIIEQNERARTWTTLTARLDGDNLATYVITQLAGLGEDAAVRPPSTATIVSTELVEVHPAPDEPPLVDEPAPAPAAAEEAAVAPEPAPEAEPAPEPAAAPHAEPEPVTETDVECTGKHDGCAGMVETEEQVNLSQFKFRQAFCINCHKIEVAAAKTSDSA